MATNNDKVVYAYRGDHQNEKMDSDPLGIALNAHNAQKYVDHCGSDPNLAPEPFANEGSYPGTTGKDFDKSNPNEHTSNCDTTRGYSSNGSHDCRWENCSPSFGNHQQMTMSL